MYTMALDMNLTDKLVKRVVEEMIEDERRISAQIIADELDCAEITARRSLGRLVKARIIERSGVSRNGFSYALIDR